MRIQDTFMRAGAVLAIDSELLDIPYDNDIRDLMHRLAMCGWMKRLWTYLEAALSIKRLYIQLKGGALHMWQATIELNQLECGATLRHRLAFKVARNMKNLYGYYISHLNQVRNPNYDLWIYILPRYLKE